ncbi:hypothetical protein GCM10025858_12490 [Alicyclobacillus sacchari]|nr:hypothetical protein GCM10025858_12490 [Alicyclobacillus sacchari]
MKQDTADIVIVGAGLAGMAAALAAAKHSDVAVLSKTAIAGTNSYFAQGGIAASVDPADEAIWHMEDTLAAGAGLCDPAAVRTLTELAPNTIHWLIGAGVRFDRDSIPVAPGAGRWAWPLADRPRGRRCDRACDRTVARQRLGREGKCADHHGELCGDRGERCERQSHWRDREMRR